MHSFKKGHQPRTDLVNVENGYVLVVCQNVWNTRRWNNYFCLVLNGKIDQETGYKPKALFLIRRDGIP